MKKESEMLRDGAMIWRGKQWSAIKSTHEVSGLFQIKHYSVQSANDFVVCITNRGYSLT